MDNKNLIILVLVLLISHCECVTSFKEIAMCCKLTLYMMTSLPFQLDLHFDRSLPQSLVNIVGKCMPAGEIIAQETKSVIVGETCRNPFQTIVAPHPIFLPVYVPLTPFFK